MPSLPWASGAVSSFLIGSANNASSVSWRRSSPLTRETRQGLNVASPASAAGGTDPRARRSMVLAAYLAIATVGSLLLWRSLAQDWVNEVGGDALAANTIR